LAAFREQFGFGRLFLEVADVGEAESAADQMQVKMNVVCGVLWERLQEESAEIGATGAGQATPLPDFTDGVSTLIALANQCGSPLPQHWIFAEAVFKLGEAVGRKLFVEPRGEFAVCPVHGMQWLWVWWVDSGRLLTGVYRGRLNLANPAP